MLHLLVLYSVLHLQDKYRARLNNTVGHNNEEYSVHKTMRPLTLPIIAGIVFITVSLPILWVVRMYERKDMDTTKYYLSIRVEDVDKNNIVSHVKNIDKDREGLMDWAIPIILKAVEEYPEGRLFFYNTSEEQWKNLGGEMGYAIIQNNRIVWKQRLKIS